MKSSEQLARRAWHLGIRTMELSIAGDLVGMLSVFDVWNAYCAEPNAVDDAALDRVEDEIRKWEAENGIEIHA